MVQTVEKNLYFNTLDEIKSQIAKSQTRTFFSVNYQMILLYWKVGEIIDKRQQNEGWGSKIIPQLSKDITNDFPVLKGFSQRNIKRMLRFYREYKNTPKAQNEIVPQTVAQIEELIFFIPWSHNIVLIEKIKDKQKRLFYMKKILEEGYSRNVLIHQIESRLFERSANATHNFAHTLPQPESDLVHEIRLNARRFGTAKRLKQLLNLIEEFFNQSIFRDFNLLIPIQYILTFGSVKHAKVELIYPSKGGLWN